MIYIFSDADNNEEIFRSDLDLESMMVDWVSNREGDDGESIRVGQAMINGMEKYLSVASWHSGWIAGCYGLKPIMWFGIDGEKPEEGWILNDCDNLEAGSTWSTFWFCDEPWDDWKNRVPDADDGFLTWMTMECDMSLPKLADALKTCPIEVDEKDDYERITKKIKTYIDSKENDSKT